jgi:hypothetical protein
MRVWIAVPIFCALLNLAGFTNKSAAQSPAQNSSDVRIAAATPVADKAPKFTFVLFWKGNSPGTQAMFAGLNAAVAKRADRAQLIPINANDPQSAATVEQYHVARAPMPIAICVAPNGVITGALTKQVTEQAIDNLLVTPAMAELAKVLQDKRIAVIHVQPEPRQPLPVGAAQFVADPAFKDRTTVVNVVLGDPEESRFVKEMEVGTEPVAQSSIVVIAPPGVLVGKFPAGATANQIAAALHAAGKCCNDPNCKHNQQGQKGQ